MPNPPRQLLRLADALARRPALPLASLFILGLLSHRLAFPSPLLWITLAASLLLAATLAFRHRKTSTTLLSLAIVTSGVAAAQLALFHYPANHIAHFAADDPRLATLELRVAQVPRTLHQGTHEPRPLRPRQVTQAEVLRVLTRDGWRPASGVILLQINVPRNDIEINQTLTAFGLLQRPRRAMNPGQFDWATYYRDQRILASLVVPHADNVRVLSSPGPTPLDRLRAAARHALQQGFTEQHSRDHALLRALVLGDPDPQLRDVQADFVRTGTSHHLAISGMHVAMLGLVVFGLCRVFLVRPRPAAVIGLVVVVLYAFVVLPSAPVLRSVFLCLALGVGILFHRSVDGIQLLSLTVFGMLVYDPADLHAPGFQLSFVTVLGLMLLATPTYRLLYSWLTDPDMEIARQVRPPPAGLALLFKLRNGLLATLAAGLVAWAVSAPLVVFHFNQISFTGLLGSLALAPVVFLALVAGFLKLLLTPLFPAFADTLATFAAYPIRLMRHMVEWFATLPGNGYLVPQPPPWLLLLTFASLLLPLLFPADPTSLHQRRRRSLRTWTLRSTPALGLSALLFLPSTPWLSPAHAPDHSLSLTLLSVGAGQCAVLRTPSGRTMLFDAGSASMDLSRTVLEPYLRHAGLRSLDALFLSHANADHFNAAEPILAARPHATIYLNPHFETHAHKSATARALLTQLRNRNSPPRPLTAGQTLTLEPGLILQVLWPPPDASLVPNDSSLVLKLTYATRSLLFTGDIQRTAMAALLTDPSPLRADVLIAPHHGSSEDTTEAFLAAVSPGLILSSNDPTLTQKQRRFDALAAGTPLLRTHECGAVTVTIQRDGTTTTHSFLSTGPAPSTLP